MEFGLTTGRRVKKAESNLASYQKALKQHENKKVFETMMSLAQFGELTPERYGQMFNAGEVNDIHYQKYNWYRETNKHVVEWDEFNDIEKANLRFLISIEEEYGYR